MKRNFYIDNITNPNDVNALSIALNALEEVSRIKIRKQQVSFVSEQSDNLQGVIKEINPTLVLKEEIVSENRHFEYSDEKREMIFMFTKLDTQEEANQIEEVLSKYSMYEEVEVDFTNKLLKVKTTDKKAILRINRIVDKVDPEIQIEEWRKPFKSQDIFQERYLARYIRIAIFTVALALGIVTKDDPTILTRLAWLVALAITCEKMLRQTYKQWSVKKYTSENNLVLLSCLFGWLYGAYIESIFIAVIYQLGEHIFAKLTAYTMEKIDATIQIPQVGRKEIDGEVTMVSLADFDIGDTLVVLPGETIPLGGTVISGKSTLDMYSVTGSEIEEAVKKGDEVQSGSVNVKETIKIKVEYNFSDSALTKVLQIATLAPANASRTYKLVEMISKYFTIAIVVLALGSGIILPILDITNNMPYFYFAAILLAISGTFAYKQSSSFAVLAGVAKAFSKGIMIRENSGLDTLNSCRTIIYDRFDGVEVDEEEWQLFEEMQKLNREIIIFNDGPVTLENDQYQIHNDLTVEEKIAVMEKASILGPVAYIGDSVKDVVLLQKAYVGISRGGLHDKKVVDNCDIMLLNSKCETLIETFNISKKQKSVILQNMLAGITSNIILLLMALSFVLSWWIAVGIYLIVSFAVLLNTHRILK